MADTLPKPPAFLKCGNGKQGYGLYWIDQSNNEVKFKIYRAVNSTEDQALFTEVKSTTGATEGTEYFCKIDYLPENFYTYKATSVNSAGESSPSNIALIPKRPLDLSGKADSISVTLDWTYPADSWIQLIFVERSKSPDSAYAIMAPIVSQNGVKFIDYSLDRGVDYYYRIRGVFYQSKSKVTCYTTPTQSVGPFRIPVVGKNYDGEISFQGENYKFKTFGKQTWMIENLAFLPEVNPSSSVSASEKRYYVYGYQGADVTKAKQTDQYRTYGVLYNWTAASDGISILHTDPIGVQGICPDGWHLPGNPEWLELSVSLNRIRSIRDSIIGADAIRKGIKGVQTATRFEGDFARPDFKDFDAHPGGYLRSDSSKFLAIGQTENYWSSTSRILTDRGMNIKDADKAWGFPVRCLKGAAMPIIKTSEISAITEKTAVFGGNVTHDGGAPVTSRGVCWSTLETPAITGNTTKDGTGEGIFSSTITGLTSGTLYFVRAYATNSAGTAYGELQQFSTGGAGALPSVSTGDISEIGGNSAAVGGNLTAYGGSEVSARGVCWSTKKTPTVSNNKVTDESGKAVFTGYLPELSARTTYFVRAYATNSFGTSYGEEKQFTTGEKGEEGTFEYDGKAYAYKTIGTQTWMTENLAYLPSVSPATAGTMEKPYYYVAYFDGTSVDSAKSYAYYKKYGVLYNWKAALTACPSGWHLPSNQEMIQLSDYLTNYGYGHRGSGNDIAKSMAATTGWDSLDIVGSIGYRQILNNRSGFNALPAGQRTVPRNGMVSNVHKAAMFWTSTEFKEEKSSANSMLLYYSHSVFTPYPNADKRNGYSVRCLKDK